MALHTNNFSLEKPEDNEFYSIHVQNANMDKIDMGLQENKQKLLNHENNNSKHLTEEITEKIENAIQPLEHFTSGNFVKVNPDGTLSDSGFNQNSFSSDSMDDEHRGLSIYSENGVHNFRYNNEKLQIFDGVEWIDITSKSVIQTVISVDSGSVITVTNGLTTLTGISVNGKCDIVIPNFGTWLFSATLNGETTNEVSMIIDTVKLYNIELSYFKSTLKVSTDTFDGKTLYYKSPTMSEYISTTVNRYGFSNSAFNDIANFTLDDSFNVLSVNFEIKNKGTYNFYAVTSDGKKSNEVTREITNSDNTQIVNITLDFYKIAFTVWNIIGTDRARITIKQKSDNSIIYDGVSDEPLNYKISFSMYCNYEDYIVTVVYQDVYLVEKTFTTNLLQRKIDLEFPNIYGFKIYNEVLDPKERVQYIGHAQGMIAGSTDWDDTEIFSEIKPYSLAPSINSGTIELNPNDFTKTLGGQKVTDLYPSYSDYDIMIRFPELYYKISIDSEDNSHYYFYVSDTPFKGSIKWDNRYIGAYLAYTASNMCAYSHSSKSPTDNQSFTVQKTHIENRNNSKYRMFNYDDLLMLQILFILRYKNTDSESALGRGFVSGESKAFTGRLDQKGMYSGSSTSGASMDGIKFCGLEDFWGNCFCFVDGLTVGAGRTLDKNNSTYGGYSADTIPSGCYFSEPYSALFPFIQKAKNNKGSSSTHYCDYQRLIAPSSGKNVACFGSVFNGGYGMSGLFCLYIERTADNMHSSSIGSRVVYQP